VAKAKPVKPNDAVNALIAAARRRVSPGTIAEAAQLIGKSRRISSEQKAIWHHVTGVGKSKVKRPFFDASDEDRKDMIDGLERLIAARIAKAGG
jgi:hypothetical protein